MRRDDRDAGEPVLDLVLPAEPPAGAVARGAVRAALSGALTGDRLDDVVLVVHELVANSVMHVGHGEVRVRLWSGERVRIEVGDAGAGFDPGRRRPADAARHAGGLDVVGALSVCWDAGPPPEGRVRVVMARG